MPNDSVPFAEVNIGSNNHGNRYPMYTFLPELLAIREKGPYTALEILRALNTFLSYPKVRTALGTVRGKVIEGFDRTSISFALGVCLILSKKLVEIIGIDASNYVELTSDVVKSYRMSGFGFNFKRGSQFWTRNEYVRVPKDLTVDNTAPAPSAPASPGSSNNITYAVTTIPRVTKQENGADKRYYDWSLYNANPPIDTTHKDTRNISTVYVNTDFVEGHVVGNTISNVLRSIHVAPCQTLINKEFEHLQFYPLRNTNFSQIKFELTDDTGKELKLNNGVTSLTLALKEVV